MARGSHRFREQVLRTAQVTEQPQDYGQIMGAAIRFADTTP